MQESISLISYKFAEEFKDISRRTDDSYFLLWKLRNKYLKIIYDEIILRNTEEEKIKANISIEKCKLPTNNIPIDIDQEKQIEESNVAPDNIKINKSTLGNYDQNKITIRKQEIDRNNTKDIMKAEERFKNVKIISKNNVINAIKSQIVSIADNATESNVLFWGESGTGKELFAEALHLASNRKGQYIKVNIPTITDKSFEDACFGHSKGAYTGAHKEEIGLFRMANHGTIFLDEIGDIDIDSQVKLLRVIENKEVIQDGSNKLFSVDVMIIFATNKNIYQAVRDRSFRNDLFHRIEYKIYIPPLRERKDDIPRLIEYFIEESYKEKKITNPPLYFDDNSLEELSKLKWEGNVRQLKNWVNQILLRRYAKQNFAPVTLLDIEQLRDYQEEISYCNDNQEIKTLHSEKRKTDEEIITAKRIWKTDKAAAKALGIDRRTVWVRKNKLKKLGLWPLSESDSSS